MRSTVSWISSISSLGAVRIGALESGDAQPEGNKELPGRVVQLLAEPLTFVLVNTQQFVELRGGGAGLRAGAAFSSTLESSVSVWEDE